MPTILELFKKSPGVYTQAQNSVNFEKADGTPSPKKLLTKSLVSTLQTKPELYSNAKNLINFDKIDGASLKKLETPTLIKIFKSSPTVYSRFENSINFEKVDGIISLKKVDQTPLSDNNTKNIDKRGIYYNSSVYKSGINYSEIDYSRKTPPISIFGNNNLDTKINKGFNKLFSTKVFSPIRNNIEQDLNGIRISSGVEKNNTQLYGVDSLRFASRSTQMLDIMKNDRGLSGGGVLNDVTKVGSGTLNDIKELAGFPQQANE